MQAIRCILDNFKVAKFSKNDFIESVEDVNESLNECCSRDGRFYRIQAVCQTDYSILFTLERVDEKCDYVIAPFLGTSEEDIIADVYSHWSHRSSTRGLIKINDNEFLGVFEKPLNIYKA